MSRGGWTLRAEVEDFQPYEPGRAPRAGGRRLVRLNANENPLGPSPKAVAAIRKNAPGLHRYPDGFSSDLRQALAQRYRVAEAQVSLGAGSDELIALLGLAFLSPGDEVVVTPHTFPRYALAAQMMGARVVTAPVPDFVYAPAVIRRAMTKKTKFVFIANPNNPTGHYLSREGLRRLWRGWPQTAALVLDEAYGEMAQALQPDFPDSLADLRKGKPVLVLRTFSKSYGLAGARVGYALGPRPLIEGLERVRLPYNLSGPAQSAAVAALKDAGHLKRTIQTVRRGLVQLSAGLTRRGFSVLPSAGNFLMVHTGSRPAAEVARGLARRGVMVRALGDYGLPYYLRVSVGSRSENAAFLGAL